MSHAVWFGSIPFASCLVLFLSITRNDHYLNRLLWWTGGQGLLVYVGATDNERIYKNLSCFLCFPSGPCAVAAFRSHLFEPFWRGGRSVGSGRGIERASLIMCFLSGALTYVYICVYSFNCMHCIIVIIIKIAFIYFSFY